MEIKHKTTEGGGIFAALDGNNTLGEMIYHMETPEVMSIDHTEVKPEEQGNNIGIKLLDFATEHVRSRNIKIRPACAFVGAMFRKYNDKYKDVQLKQST